LLAHDFDVWQFDLQTKEFFYNCYICGKYA